MNGGWSLEGEQRLASLRCLSQLMTVKRWLEMGYRIQSYDETTGDLLLYKAKEAVTLAEINPTVAQVLHTLLSVTPCYEER